MEQNRKIFDKEIELDNFLQIAEENKDILYMKTSGNHSINKENVKKIYDNIDNNSTIDDEAKNKAKEFIKIVFSNFEYVSFDVFMNKIKNLAEQVKNKLLNELKDKNIYFIVNKTFTVNIHFLLVIMYFLIIMLLILILMKNYLLLMNTTI